MKRCGLVLVACALAVSVLAAQLKVDVALVNVVATVTDDKGRYVPDLSPDDLIVEEDGQVQTISHFSQSNDLPVSMGVVLDTSGGTSGRTRSRIYTANWLFLTIEIVVPEGNYLLSSAGVASQSASRLSGRL